MRSLLFPRRVAGGRRAADPPLKSKDAAFCCPVVGFPEAKDKCCCPGGYCPKKPSPRITVEHRGQRVQLCCSKCIKLFQKEPAKFAANANHQLAARGLARQVRCPLCGGSAKAAHAVDVA